MEKSSRIKWIDIYKGILIILMVLAHTPGFYVKYIYAFHMAAFFFISGYTQNFDKSNFIEFVKKKFKKLIIPFFVVNIIFYLFIISMKCFGIYNIYYNYDIDYNSVINLFRFLYTSDIGGATWFLVVLFLSLISAKLLHELTNGKKYQNEKNLFYSTLLIIIVYYLYYQTGNTLPFYLDLIPMGLFFVEIGSFSKNCNYKINKTFKIIVSIFLLIFYVWFTKYNYTQIEWTTRIFPNIFIMFLSSMSGIMIVYFISKFLLILEEKIKIEFNLLEYIGKNTLPILLYHFLGFRIFFTILYLFNIVGKSQLLNLIPEYRKIILCFLTTIFAISFSLCVNKIVKTIKKFDFEKYNKKNIICFILIFILTFIVYSWTLKNRNFFLLDDWNNLVTLPYVSVKEFFTILPTSVYCSRPVGWLIVKILLIMFGLNYKMHAFSMILIHFVNMILLYFIVNKICKDNKNKNIISFISMIIFGLYPITTFAVFWEAGMFDLIGTTLILISLLFSVKLIYETNSKIKKIIYSILAVCSYYFSLRAKEMFIALPIAILMLSIFKYIKSHKKLSKKDIKSLFKENIIFIVMIIIMMTYFIFSRVLNASSSITHDINDPYYYSFNIVGMVKNLFSYIFAMFNSNALVYGNFTNIVKFSVYYKVSMIILLTIFIIYSCYKFIKKDYTPFILILFFCFIIAPVLPMQNMHHVLYLYAPSIFMAIFISYMMIDLFLRIINKKYLLIIVILSLIAINCSSGVNTFRNWWLDTANTDHKTYNYFVNVSKKYKNVDKIYMVNVPENGYTSFYNGPGFVIKVAYDNPKLKVYINKNNYNLNKTNQLIIDFNNYDFKIINEK